MATPPPVRSESLSQQAYRELRSWILSGELKPGQRIPLRPVAKSLGMSLAPVGEAIRALTHSGLVEMEPGWGARVRNLTTDGLRDQHVLRMAIECEAIRQCVEHASRAAINEIYELAEDLDSEIDAEGEPAIVRDLDSQFHMLLARSSGIESLVEALKANQLVRLLAVGSELASQRAVPKRQHIELAEAIAEGDADAAALKMREHCIRSMRLQIEAAQSRE